MLKRLSTALLLGGLLGLVPTAAGAAPTPPADATEYGSHPAQAYDLSWLEHLVGDIHQPLHAVSRYSVLHPGGDHGGNEFHLDDPADPKLSLHWFWDSALAADPDPQKVIALAKSLTGDYARDDRDLGPGIDADFLLEHGEPHDPCPVEGCAGELRFAHR